MKPKDYVKSVALGACVTYTVTIFLILFFYFLLNKDLSDGVRPVALIAVLPFAILFASANVVYRKTPLAKWLRVLIHYVLTVGGAFLCLYLPNKDPDVPAAKSMILFLIFTAVYAVIMAAVLLIAARIRRVKRDEGKYNSVYKQ